MIIRMALVLLLLASCSYAPQPKIAKTVEVSAQRLAEIRANPHVKRYQRIVDPAARLTALDGDPWPAGIMFFSVMDPYLEELGFDNTKMIAAINDKKVHDIFAGRWQKKRIRRPAGFHNDHYRDLIEYLFIEQTWNQFIVTVYLDVPRSYDEVKNGSYVPKVEHWRIKFK